MELRMSRKERDRMKVVEALGEGRLRQVEAARRLRLCERQVRRILVRYRAEGDAGLVHRGRGRPSNRRLPETLRRRVMDRVVRQYRDFGPTLAAEKLQEREGLLVSRETLRGWMVAEGLWKPRRPRREVHLWRPRRSSFGELVQMDTSEHAWFEGRGQSEPVLVSMIDDATGRQVKRFFASDTTEANLQVLGLWLRRHGRMLALYADRDSIFRVNRPPSAEEALQGRQAVTQFGRALRDLGIAYIPAGSPQAKGRVERSFQTDQDRLVKELRLRGIADIASANAYLEAEYVPMLNRRFTVAAASTVDAHRPLNGHDLGAILSVQTLRTVAKDYTVRHGGRRYQIQRRSITGGLRSGRVIVEERVDGTLRLRFRGRYLRFHEVPPAPTPRPPRLGVGASGPPPGPPAPTPYRPREDHPWRRPFKKKRTFLSCGKPDISTLR
jgi:hypothetical protein